MNKYKISVIVPACNAGSTIEESINSILSQGYNDLECIIVENNSADRTYDICAEIAAKEPSVRLFSIKCKGVSGARNFGLGKAEGDIIGFCDADDRLEPGTLAAVNEEFMNAPELSCVIGALYRETDGKKEYFGAKRKLLSVRDAMGFTICDNRVLGSVCNKYYKREALKNIFFDEELTHCEDTHFNIAAMSEMKDKSILLTDTAFYVYKYNPRSVTNRSDLLFNENNELRYIFTLNRIMGTNGLNSKVLAYTSMKKAILAADHLYGCTLDKSQYEKLYLELKNNFIYLVRYFYKFGLKSNIRSILLSLWLLLRLNRIIPPKDPHNSI